MPKMFHDMEEDVVRRRIEKASNERANPKNRLENAMPLVELVGRLLECGCDEEQPEEVQGESEPTTQEELEAITDAPEVVGEHRPAVTPEEFEPAVDGEGKPVTADSLGLNDEETEE